MTKQLFAKMAAAAMIAVAAFLGTVATAQNRAISGKVVDASGAPVVGAAIVVVGNASIGAVTDAGGNFRLNVPAGANINVSCIGYADQTLSTANQSVFNIVLEEDTEFLDETVVIGYGVQRKSDLTGAVASVRSEDLQNRSVTDAAAALQGKALLFAKDYAGAKAALKKVIDSGKYALVPGSRYWENFHVEGDANEEKVFESNIEFNSGIGAWGGINQRSTWMEANIWSWRVDHFAAAPHLIYQGGADGWGGLGVPQWFGDEFFANDGHSYRFDATLKHIDDAVYGMEYGDSVGEKDEDGNVVKKVSDMTLEEKKATKAIGISDVKDGLYGQSFWLPFKQMVRGTDCGDYGNNVRLNNNIVMRYAEVLLLYAEACLGTGDSGQATWAVNEIQKRAGSKTVSGSVNMDILKKEKSYELWLEGCRWLDQLRWGDLARSKQAGQAVPKLFDKLYRTPASGEKITWENGTEANSRFYTVDTHEAIDAKWKVGFQDKHRFYPYPTSVMDKNPNIVQNPGWEGTPAE